MVKELEELIKKEKRSKERGVLREKLVAYKEQLKKTMEDKRAMEHFLVEVKDNIMNMLREEDQGNFAQHTERMLMEK